jgi:hypothetical protein
MRTLGLFAHAYELMSSGSPRFCTNSANFRVLQLILFKMHEWYIPPKNPFSRSLL